MGALSLSSSPLTSLMPQTSPHVVPNYADAFKMNILPMMDQMKLKVGLTTMDSSDPMTAMKGESMVDEAIKGSSLPTQENSSGATFDWGAGFGALSQVGSRVGGLAGLILSGVGNLGSSIWKVKEAGKGLKGGAGMSKAGAVGSIIGAASDMVGSFLPEKTEYAGPKGDITQTMDSVYDGIADAAMAIPGWGTLVGGIMKGGALLGKGMNALGGGTDGMCVCAGTKVFKANGELISIENLKLEDGIIGWSEKTKQVVPQTIHNIIEPSLKECLEIITKSGYTLRCSIDHPILSDNSPRAKSHTVNGKRIAYRDWKFRRADELKVGDFVGIANNIDYWGDKLVDKAYLIGLLIGDGTYTKGNSCRLISADKSTWDYIESNGLGVINHCDGSRPDKYNTEIRTYRIINGMDLMRLAGIVYQSKDDKTLPLNIGEYTKNSVCSLIAGLYDTDGSISVNEEKGNWSITLYLSNKALLLLVKEQLHKLGIFASINTRKPATYQLGGKLINSAQSYRLEIGDISSAIKFTLLIPLNIDYKKTNLDKIYKLLVNKSPQEHPELSGAKLSKIIEIKPIGLLTVYNLLADYDHTYIANGIITHNTSTDAILGSSFLNLTPVGLVNGFGGKKADTITKDTLAFETVGSSYTGSNQTVNDALLKSGKKYGTFSSKAREQANEEIREAKRLQSMITNIADESTDRFSIRNSMAAINGNRRAFAMQGGYDLAAIRVGRSGLKLSLVQARTIILKYQRGGKALDPFLVYLNSLPQNQRDSTNYRVRDYWSFNGKPKNFEEAKQKGMFTLLEDGWHANSVAENPETGEIEFMKPSNHPTLYKELEWYNSDDGAEFRSLYELIKTQPYFKYVKRKQAVPTHKDGGSIIELITIPTEIELISTEELPEFLNGGSINVIPDGALHARKHNMDMDGITPKGIPVISEKDGGEVEQQAEIEKEEIIFRLEVTQKLEELSRKYYNNDSTLKEKDAVALEAGQLLAKEILHNTIDNTNNLL